MFKKYISVCVFCLSGTLKKVYFKSNGSEPFVTDGEVQVPGVFLATAVYNESAGAPTMPPSQSTPAWTPRATPFSGDQSPRDTRKSEVAVTTDKGREVTLPGRLMRAIHSGGLAECLSFKSEMLATLWARLR